MNEELFSDKEIWINKIKHGSRGKSSLLQVGFIEWDGSKFIYDNGEPCNIELHNHMLSLYSEPKSIAESTLYMWAYVGNEPYVLQELLTEEQLKLNYPDNYELFRKTSIKFNI